MDEPQLSKSVLNIFIDGAVLFLHIATEALAYACFFSFRSIDSISLEKVTQCIHTKTVVHPFCPQCVAINSNAYLQSLQN